MWWRGVDGVVVVGEVLEVPVVEICVGFGKMLSVESNQPGAASLL